VTGHELQLHVLASLSQSKRHGYGIYSFLTQRGMNPSMRAIYRCLTDLETRGWVKGSSAESYAGPNRKEYSLSDRGREALDHLVAEWTATWQRVQRSVGALQPSHRGHS
jgi:PadR family transcriptional regulator, regulatory protein PadR